MSSSGLLPFQTLHFLGKMNVHLTHELQNVMATISETSGLLDDLVDLLNQGADIDRSRLGVLTGRVVSEIERGHRLVGQINSFAHSVDTEEATMDLVRLTHFMADVAPCLPYARPVDVTVKEPCDMTWMGRPYYWEQLLYGCIMTCFHKLGADQRIALALSCQDGKAVFEFKGLSNEEDAPEFPDPMTREAITALGAQVSLQRDSGSLKVEAPISA